MSEGTFPHVVALLYFFFFFLSYSQIQGLDHLWDHGNLFEIWVVSATEDYS